MGLFEVERTPLRIVDSVAATQPQTLYCIQPVSSDVTEGWVKVNFKTLLNAINRTALWIQENVTSSSEPETIAYVGANDIRYTAFIFACMRLRHTVGSKSEAFYKFHADICSSGSTSLYKKLGASISACIGGD